MTPEERIKDDLFMLGQALTLFHDEPLEDQPYARGKKLLEKLRMPGAPTSSQNARNFSTIRVDLVKLLAQDRVTGEMLSYVVQHTDAPHQTELSDGFVLSKQNLMIFAAQHPWVKVWDRTEERNKKYIERRVREMQERGFASGVGVDGKSYWISFQWKGSN